MSHIVEIKAEIRDLAALKAACSRLGGTFHEGRTKYEWFGSYMGDSPLPEGVTVAELGTCHHAMSFPGCTYQVGIVQTAKGYTLRWDYWEQAIRNAMGGPEAHRLIQAYATEKAKIETRRLGSVTETTLPDGSIRLTVNAR